MPKCADCFVNYPEEGEGQWWHRDANGDCYCHRCWPEKENASLRAENARLREALEMLCAASRNALLTREALEQARAALGVTGDE